MTKIYKLFTNHLFITVLWFGLSLFAIIKMAAAHNINNYHIYTSTFINLRNHVNLFVVHPLQHNDVNLYGPIFAVMMAPFTLLPEGIGVVFWVMLNAFLLYRAILMLPLKKEQCYAVLLICAHELMTASYGEQINPMLTSFIVFSFIFIRSGKEFWAAFFIVAGTMIKLYGIVGLAFFFFTDNKLKFILSFLFWAAVLFVLPMPFSSPHFVVQCYTDWFNALTNKNAHNEISTMQDICVMGMIRRVFNYPQLNNLIVLLPGLLLFGLAYLRFKTFGNTHFQLLILASTLIFTVIFSTGSESPTYIIAFVGVGVWFMNLDRPVKPFEIFLLIFALLITSLSPSDLFPQVINRQYIKPYSFKALPCFVIWLKIVYETLWRKFEPNEVAIK